MTELERMLKDTLTRMERELSTAQGSQGRALEEQHRTLAMHSQSLRQLQEENNRNKADLHALTKRLEDLAGLYRSLEALLPLLNGLLGGK